MSSFHLSVKHTSRAKGQSSVAAAAYRSGERLEDRRTGTLHDYSRKKGIEETQIIAPSGAPEWVGNREELWNAAEQAEKRKDAKVAREFELALPSELSKSEQQALAQEFAQELTARYRVAVDVAIHQPHRLGDDRNAHAHMLTTTREITPEGLGAKCRVLDSPKTSGAEVEQLRELWANMQNRALERGGHAARVDHRTLEAQGIERAPQIHVGPHAMAMERRGEVTERGEKNRAIIAAGRELEQITATLQQAQARRIEAMETELAKIEARHRQEESRLEATAARIEQARKTVTAKASINSEVRQKFLSKALELKEVQASQREALETMRAAMQAKLAANDQALQEASQRAKALDQAIAERRAQEQTKAAAAASAEKARQEAAARAETTREVRSQIDHCSRILDAINQTWLRSEKIDLNGFLIERIKEMAEKEREKARATRAERDDKRGLFDYALTVTTRKLDKAIDEKFRELQKKLLNKLGVDTKPDYLKAYYALGGKSRDIDAFIKSQQFRLERIRAENAARINRAVERTMTTTPRRGAATTAGPSAWSPKISPPAGSRPAMDAPKEAGRDPGQGQAPAVGDLASLDKLDALEKTRALLEQRGKDIQAEREALSAQLSALRSERTPERIENELAAKKQDLKHTEENRPKPQRNLLGMMKNKQEIEDHEKRTAKLRSEIERLERELPEAINRAPAKQAMEAELEVKATSLREASRSISYQTKQTKQEAVERYAACAKQHGQETVDVRLQKAWDQKYHRDVKAAYGVMQRRQAQEQTRGQGHSL
jgi:hypothetical protein